jgi:hypothetical protein
MQFAHVSFQDYVKLLEVPVEESTLAYILTGSFPVVGTSYME